MNTTTQSLDLGGRALWFRRLIHWNISTGPPSRQFNSADQAHLMAMPRTEARTNEEIILPRQTGGWRFGSLRSWLAAFFVIAGPVLAASQPDSQSGSKMVGAGAVGLTEQGWSVAVSADGKTAIVGGIVDNRLTGAAWVYIRSGDSWTQQGNKLVGTGEVGQAAQGWSVALSADGNTAILGGPYDNSNTGAAWVYTRNGTVWTQQGNKLVGNGLIGRAGQGVSVALSADGTTAIVGGSYDNSSTGAAWVYTRSGGVWTQQGNKLVGTGAAGIASQGSSVALSGDGNTAIVGGPYDKMNSGAAWVYTRNGDVWTQQSSKLIGDGAVGQAAQGFSVALSADGNTAIVGGPHDNSYTGAVWVYTRSSDVWTQQGNKLVGTGAVGNARQGRSVALSGDGNTVIVGGPHDNSYSGASWVYARSGTVWKQQGSKLIGTGAVGHAEQGFSVALSTDGSTAIAGAHADNRITGAAWVHTRSGGVWTPIPAPSPGF
jgi:antibiotic biosynthesis monooxygenase (ABM) superfamily enzyme